MAVATSESVFEIPHFASMEVIPAKKAEPIAYIIHISKFTSSYTSFKQLETNSSKNRTCSFPAYGSPLLLLNILVIDDFVTAPNINMDIRVNDSVIPYFIQSFQFKTSSLTPSIQPFERKK